MTTIFKKIIDREIPAEIVFEDERCLAFKDVDPQAPVHVLLIPKKEIPSFSHLSEEDNALVGHMMLKAGEIAQDLGLEKYGYRVVTNVGPHGGQTVFHLHFHILGGRPLAWPPG